MTWIIYLNYEMYVFLFWFILVYSRLRRFLIINKETATFHSDHVTRLMLTEERQINLGKGARS